MSASSPHKATFSHVPPGILWCLECCILLQQSYQRRKELFVTEHLQSVSRVSSLRSLWDSTGDSDPGLEKVDGLGDPSRSFGALTCMDTRVHQPQGHLWHPACFCFQFPLHHKTLQHPTGCCPCCFGSTPRHLFRPYSYTRWLHLKLTYHNHFGWAEITSVSQLLGEHGGFQFAILDTPVLKFLWVNFQRIK